MYLVVGFHGYFLPGFLAIYFHVNYRISLTDRIEFFTIIVFFFTMIVFFWLFTMIVLDLFWVKVWPSLFTDEAILTDKCWCVLGNSLHYLFLMKGFYIYSVVNWVSIIVPLKYLEADARKRYTWSVWNIRNIRNIRKKRKMSKSRRRT